MKLAVVSGFAAVQAAASAQNIKHGILVSGIAC